MARLVTPLTDNKCNTSKAMGKDIKLFDGGGLYLLVKKNNGSKIWRFKYIRPDGRATELSVGKYPTVSLRYRFFRFAEQNLMYVKFLLLNNGCMFVKNL